MVDGDVNDEIFAEIFVTATRKGSDYTVTFTFPRRALSRKDVKGVFPKDSPHGYDGTPLAIISRDKTLFFDFSGQQDRVKIRIEEKMM